MRNFSLILLAGMLVAACDSGPKTPPPDLVKSQREAMDKAKQTGAVLDQAAADRLEKAEKESK